MKCSEFLWRMIALKKGRPELSMERVQGEVRAAMAPGEYITANTDGARMTDREALSVYGRNEGALVRAHELGRRQLFDRIVEGQQIGDDEWHAAQEGDAEEHPEQDAED